MEGREEQERAERVVRLERDETAPPSHARKMPSARTHDARTEYGDTNSPARTLLPPSDCPGLRRRDVADVGDQRLPPLGMGF